MQEGDQLDVWYPAEWFAREDRAEGMRVTLGGGPLDGRTAQLEDFGIWIALRHGRLFMHCTQGFPRSVPRGATILGAYLSGSEGQSLTWLAAPCDRRAA